MCHLNNDALILLSILFGKSWSMSLEYGAGLGLSGKLGFVQGSVEMTVKEEQNYDYQKKTINDWAFHLGFSLGLQAIDTEFAFKGVSTGKGFEQYIMGLNLPFFSI